MESQIIDYYNETPHGINVIDKLNEEYSDLQSKYESIKSYNNRYIAPIQISKTFDEYKKYEKNLNEEFPEKIREILNDKESGLLAVYRVPSCPIGQVYSKLIGCGWAFYCNSGEEWCKDKIINELDNITKNKNRKWCEDRINIAFETCFAKFNTISSTNVEKVIDELIHHILNNEKCNLLPDFYTETINLYTNENIDNGLELDFYSLYSLNCYHCEKCGILESYIEEDITMRCQDCLYI
jgi:hypothetical protein